METPAADLGERPREAIRLVAFDLDGTILEGGNRIVPTLLIALRDLASVGICCVTATGRPLDFQLELLARHGMGPASHVFKALIADERELHVLDERGAYRPHEEWNAPVRRRWLDLHPIATSWLERGQAEAARQEWPASSHLNGPISAERGLAALSFRHVEHAEMIRAWLQSQIADAAVPIACNRNVREVQLHDIRAGKGAVLAELAQLWGLRPQQMLAIGDSDNDRSMLDGTLGFRCATVANADSAIKGLVRAQGGYVAAATGGAGVAEVLRALNLGQPSPR